MSKYDTKTTITNFNVNWQRIKSACMTTISKKAGDKEPPREWKRKLLICRHSPIRRGVKLEMGTYSLCHFNAFC